MACNGRVEVIAISEVPYYVSSIFGFIITIEFVSTIR